MRVVASVTFKNYIKRHWRLTEETDFVDKISAADRLSVGGIISFLWYRYQGDQYLNLRKLIKLANLGLQGQKFFLLFQPLLRLYERSFSNIFKVYTLSNCQTLKTVKKSTLINVEQD